MTPTVEEIVKGLSEAQRTWLLAAEPTLERVAKTPCAEWWDNPEALYVEIDDGDIWLARRSMMSPEGSPDFTEGWEQLTETGLSVRTYLESMGDGNG